MISINMSACSPKSSILSYGAFVEGNQTTFKIHAPRSTEVYLVIFKKPEDAHVIRLLIHEGTIKLQSLHKYLEDEITAIHYVE